MKFSEGVPESGHTINFSFCHSGCGPCVGCESRCLSGESIPPRNFQNFDQGLLTTLGNSKLFLYLQKEKVNTKLVT